MSRESTESTHRTAIEALETFGLTSYAARTYLALANNGTSTAREVSEATDVPRTRVYDAIDELEEWNLVNTRANSPKEFSATTPRLTSRRLGREYDRRAAHLTLALLDVDGGDGRPLSDAESVGETVDESDGESDPELSELLDVVSEGVTESRSFVLRDENGEEVPFVFRPGENGAKPELRLVRSSDTRVEDEWASLRRDSASQGSVRIGERTATETTMSDGRVVRSVDWQELPPSVAVVELLSEVLDVDPLQISQLQETVDTDSLDAICISASDPQSGDPLAGDPLAGDPLAGDPPVVSFVHENHRVTVVATGTVAVESLDD